MTTEPPTEHMRYLGALKLLEECSPYVGEALRDSIERTMGDAVAASKGTLKTQRILDRVYIDVVITCPPELLKR